MTSTLRYRKGGRSFEAEFDKNDPFDVLDFVRCRMYPGVVPPVPDLKFENMLRERAARKAGKKKGRT